MEINLYKKAIDRNFIKHNSDALIFPPINKRGLTEELNKKISESVEDISVYYKTIDKCCQEISDIANGVKNISLSDAHEYSFKNILDLQTNPNNNNLKKKIKKVIKTKSNISIKKRLLDISKKNTIGTVKSIDSNNPIISKMLSPKDVKDYIQVNQVNQAVQFGNVNRISHLSNINDISLSIDIKDYINVQDHVNFQLSPLKYPVSSTNANSISKINTTTNKGNKNSNKKIQYKTSKIKKNRVISFIPTIPTVQSDNQTINNQANNNNQVIETDYSNLNNYSGLNNYTNESTKPNDNTNSIDYDPFDRYDDLKLKINNSLDSRIKINTSIFKKSNKISKDVVKKISNFNEKCDKEKNFGLKTKKIIQKGDLQEDIEIENTNKKLSPYEDNTSEVLNKVSANVDNASKPSFLFVLSVNDRKRFMSEENDNAIMRAYYASKIGELQSLRYTDLLAKRYGKDIAHHLKNNEYSHVDDINQLKILKECGKKAVFRSVENLLFGLNKQNVKLVTEFDNFKVRMSNLFKINK